MPSSGAADVAPGCGAEPEPHALNAVEPNARAAAAALPPSRNRLRDVWKQVLKR